jgi:hypothetical protein
MQIKDTRQLVRIQIEAYNILVEAARKKGMTIKDHLEDLIIKGSVCRACKSDTAEFCGQCLYEERMKGEEYGRKSRHTC